MLQKMWRQIVSNEYFNKICAALAFAVGIFLLVLGGIGLFVGCGAHFTLPPVLGALPALVGWGITRSIYLVWKPHS